MYSKAYRHFEKNLFHQGTSRKTVIKRARIKHVVIANIV